MRRMGMLVLLASLATAGNDPLLRSRRLAGKTAGAVRLAGGWIAGGQGRWRVFHVLAPGETRSVTKVVSVGR